QNCTIPHQPYSNRQHVQTVHPHPARPIRLLDVATSRQRRAAVEDANVIQPQEAALEDVAAFGVFAVDPPGEVEHELVEDALEECAIARAPALLLDLVDAPGRPGVHW